MSTIVRLDRSTDRERPCCENLATLRPGKGPHGAELRCAGCGRHRGWLPKQAVDFLAAIADRLGDPDPIILRDQTKSARKVRGRWVASRTALLREFGFGG
jgi:hypothetical protein